MKTNYLNDKFMPLNQLFLSSCMLFEDTYLTVSGPAKGLFKDKGSKFIAYIYPIASENEVKLLISDLKKEHPSANHYCYAFRLGADKLSFRANDDGEPANLAGKPILGQIQSKDLTNVLIVVVRYFGGTLLGVSGLINAYRSAASDGLSNATIIEKTVNDVYRLNFDYLQMNDVMKIIKDEKLEILSQDMELTCSLTFSVRKSNSNNIYELLSKINAVQITFLRTQ